MNTQNSETSSIECNSSVIKNNKVNSYNEDNLGPLPKNWERAETEHGEVYFIDHNTGSSHWLDPRKYKFQKKLEDCSEHEIPFGWQKVFDPQYGTYYIDHVNRKTQYENPVLQAKRLAEQARLKSENIYQNRFTKDPSKLTGERIVTKLMKSPKGFGFTIIGGDDSNCDFLQIKNILPNGPAWNDGKLRTGDVLVYVNYVCVLGFSHHEMINIFQSIMPDGYALIEVSRGYPLPLEDPTNTEVITISAVDGQNLETVNDSNTYSDYNTPDVLDIKILKGDNGFGFTIADSLQGQKVKKILDSETCKNIFVGDILLSINNINVKQMTHSQVVEVLKDCPKTTETTIKVLRNFYNKYRKFDEMTRDNPIQSLYRSKTPTANSTEPKTILPVRPKTPLVDTRSRIITPSSELNISELEASLHADMNKKHNFKYLKPGNDFFDASVNNNSSSFQAVSDLANQLSQLDMENNFYENKREKNYLTSASGSNGLDINSESIYSITTNNCAPNLPSRYAENDYPHVNCFCYDCQDYTERKHSDFHSNYSTLPPQMNDNVGKRLNQFINERRFHNMQDGKNHNNQWEWPQQFTTHQDGYILDITLERHATGFGFRIVGGTEENSPITVGHIVPGGAADLDGQIRTGDEILFINDISLKHASHHHVVSLMAEAGLRGQVNLVVKRRPIHYPYDVFVTRHENEGFGFVIISSSSQYYGSTIGKLIPGSPAEKSGELKIGDLIVAVNGINIIGMSHGEVVNLIKESGLQVQLTIDNPREHRLLDAQFREKINGNMSVNHFPIVC